MHRVEDDASRPAVELRGVEKRFGSRPILRGVDLAIGRGEVFALLGPSGSGKSTLLKLISGIESPDRGEVWLDGREVTSLPPYRREVHTVFQNYALFPHLNVTGNLEFPLRLAKRPRDEIHARVIAALSWVNLETLAERRVDTLSGGERQRVALARALVNDPQCVLLDEPLSALDPHLRGQTLALLQEIQSRLHVTCLYVTHDREEALRIAQRVGVLNEGRLEQVGTPESVYRSPASAFVAGFVGRINWLEAEVSHEGDRPFARLTGGAAIPLDGQKLPASSKVRIGVRPEDVKIAADGYLLGKVESRQFSGASVELKLSTDAAVLIAELPADGATPQVGEAVRVGWRPGAAHVFARDAETPS
ncbi:MAG: ABC transporter ATP-binding protein [Pirellulaceae bacterium]